MSVKTIIITAIVIILAGGAAVSAWLFIAAPQEQPSQPVQSNSGPPGQNSASGQTTPSQAATVSDLDTSYKTLFQKIGAQSVVFTSVDAGSTGALGGVYALYTADVANSKKLFPSATDFSIQVSLTDLNNDGTPEALVYENLPGSCGTGGCPFDIFTVKNGAWVNIFSALAGSDVGISNKSTNGFLDLFLSVQGDVVYQSNVVRYAWDSMTYQPQETVAVWDGSAFNLSQ